jgi:hypothetical protein
VNLIIRPAGVAQSVERVALIFSDIPNLKVAGSSPAFGYSYIQLIVLFVFFAPRRFVERGCVGEDENSKDFFLVVKPGLGGQGWRWTWRFAAFTFFWTIG